MILVTLGPLRHESPHGPTGRNGMTSGSESAQANPALVRVIAEEWICSDTASLFRQLS